jgi:signal transduction histidine kinase
MRVRHRSIRIMIFFLVVIPLLSLIGVYAFATTITARDALTLARSTAVRGSIADPIGSFETEVAVERLLAATYLASPAPQILAALNAQEAKTDTAWSLLRAAASSADARSASSPQVKAALAALLKDAADLTPLRRQISSRTISSTLAQRGYSATIAAGYNAITQAVLQMPNVPLVTQALAVMRVTESSEILLQEEALLVGDVMARSFPPADHQKFAELVGAHRGILTEAMSDLDPVYRSYYQQDLSAPAVATLAALENAVINSRPGVVPRVPLTAYEQAAGAVSSGLGAAGFRSGITLAHWGRQAARPIDVRLIVAGGLGLLALIVSIIVSVGIGRGLARRLAGLKGAALELAHERLPQVVARLSAGEDVDVDAEVPSLTPGTDEIGQVRQAINAVQRTAIEAAVGQARLRAGISAVFRNLARRSQSLLHRQLALLDELEQRAAEPDELESLFRIDHLTTRMRRHAEGLMVLAGDRPARGWSNPVLLIDVLRAAIAEVADYTRIRAVSKSRTALAGRAVADVIHVIAELAENAAIFSPPNTPVRMVGDVVGRGYAVEIEDRGLGMTGEKMAELNASLADPPELDLEASEQLGLYVAARLAKLHGIQITLRESPFGGVTAIVLIPQDLVISEAEHAADLAASLADEQAIPLTRRPAARGTGEDPGLPGFPANDKGATSSDGPGHPNGQNGASTPPGAMPGRNEAPAWFSGAADARVDMGEGRPAAGAAAETANGGQTESCLPQRTPQASLAPQLREGEGRDVADPSGGSPSARSPDEIRDALTAIQQGWERGRAESAAPGPPGAETGAADGIRRPGPEDNGDLPAPGNGQQESGS